MAAQDSDQTSSAAKCAITVFSLVLARMPDFFTICVTRNMGDDKVAENPFEDQRVTFHFPCHPTKTMHFEPGVFEVHGA